jgi:hypothetical protein
VIRSGSHSHFRSSAINDYIANAESEIANHRTTVRCFNSAVLLDGEAFEVACHSSIQHYHHVSLPTLHLGRAKFASLPRYTKSCSPRLSTEQRPRTHFSSTPQLRSHSPHAPSTLALLTISPRLSRCDRCYPSTFTVRDALKSRTLQHRSSTVSGKPRDSKQFTVSHPH